MSNIKSYKDQWNEIVHLGKGGQGETIKAFRKSDSTVAAIKKLLSQNDIERRARMRREVAALETLTHSRIPKVIDSNTEFWEDKSYKLFIATEFIEGCTLLSVDFSKVTVEKKVDLIRIICEVVDYCHSMGIVHRDLKPDNIIIRNGNLQEPVLIDFGLSFNMGEQDNDFATPTGQHLGNRFMILPEQKVGEAGKRDFRTDVTCLVALFYFILTQEVPTILLDQHEHKPHQRSKAKDIINDLPPHQRNIINNFFDIGFNQLIDRRWQTTKSLLDQIDLLKKAQVNKFDSPESLFKLINDATLQQSYEDAKFINDLIALGFSKTHSIRNNLMKELGNDWVGAATMGGRYSEGYNLHTINNNNLHLRIYAFIKIYITGSEVVVHSIVEGKDGMLSEKEVFRHPIQGEKN